VGWAWDPPAGAAQTVPTRPFLPTVRHPRCVSSCRMLRPAAASPPGGLVVHRAQRVKTVQEVEGSGWGALVGAKRRVLTAVLQLVSRTERQLLLKLYQFASKMS
jgi:hypothetical protein